MSKLLSPGQVARILGLSDCGITKLCRSGYIPAQRIGDVRQGAWVIRAEDLDGFVKPTRGRIPKGGRRRPRPAGNPTRNNPLGAGR